MNKYELCDFIALTVKSYFEDSKVTFNITHSNEDVILVSCSDFELFIATKSNMLGDNAISLRILSLTNAESLKLLLVYLNEALVKGKDCKEFVVHDVKSKELRKFLKRQLDFSSFFSSLFGLTKCYYKTFLDFGLDFVYTSFVILVLFILFSNVFGTVAVDGVSMNNTLQNGNVLVIEKIDKNVHDGQIITFSSQIAKEPLIKRVIATEGQTLNVDMLHNKVFVNGKAVPQNYIREPMQVVGNTSFPIKIPKGYVFVMGDNRNDSFDSRFSQVGLVPLSNIKGVVVFRVSPVTEMTWLW